METETGMETGKNMSDIKKILLAILLLGVPVCAWAQTRESNDSQQAPAVAPEAQVNGDSDNSGGTQPAKTAASAVGEIPYTRDAFSTTMTGTRVMLGPGDRLEISVFDTPELTQSVRVNSDGKITLALIGEIAVRGMSPEKLSGVIARKLVDGNFMKDPQVSVFVLEYAGQMAYVTGEVSRPGAYALLRSHRLLDLLSVAGGLTSRAGNTLTIVRGDDPSQHILVDLNDKGENRSNPEILPGDSITVAQSGIVYVLGDVSRPGGFLLDRRTNLSIVQALALAEGTKSSAALSKALLIRTTQGNRQVTPLDLKTMLKSQSPDLLLEAGDIVFVPGSLTRGMGKTSLEVIMSSAGLAAVYATRP
jgi:polysaccharide export outer membrane protein